MHKKLEISKSRGVKLATAKKSEPMIRT